jgi:hypothetical protein
MGPDKILLAGDYNGSLLGTPLDEPPCGGALNLAPLPDIFIDRRQLKRVSTYIFLRLGF